ncbi:hypothetical protein MLD38_036044 [Melastoma candidum]|uniref:Uncharacterized protein n=1 Tax=Melastoma candidum TaxID=119954 RepID=A0ACB9LII0_9MYRT|nr:hypothetical protein MLD38_036044 [Melastoma candidum]
MARAPGGSVGPGGKTGVRIVVVGDRGTGKSSLICTAATEVFPGNVPPFLPPTRLPEDTYPDRVPITIIDTSSRVEESSKLGEELRRADAVVLTYACEHPETLDRPSTFWLPELRRLEACPHMRLCIDLQYFFYQYIRKIVLLAVVSLVISPSLISQLVLFIYHVLGHGEVLQFVYLSLFFSRFLRFSTIAQKAVLHPTGRLFDQETQTLKPRCVMALKRIFILCHHDRDGALSDEELNDFQVKCFSAPLQPSEIVGVKRVVQEKLSKGLAANLIPIPVKKCPDQSVELTNEAIHFIEGIFDLFDGDADGALRPMEIECLFSTAPECPWNEAPYRDTAEKTTLGGFF